MLEGMLGDLFRKRVRLFPILDKGIRRDLGSPQGILVDYGPVLGRTNHEDIAAACL